ncbi:MAG: UvrD-helicase domain-containing protein [Myxococcales bacterium]|nr:UvrD-helicase domain-containing protein [Myxococcales bacterium]
MVENKNPQMTAQQAEAIQTQGRPLLVEAGAGTGKTWVLVERFVYLLQSNPSWPLEGIAAITFTEKAAREMRVRIRRRVEALATEHKSDPQSPWHRHRQDLDRLLVGTIHGFCAQILRENALVAELDPAFGVLDEQEAQLLQQQAIRETLQRLTVEERLLGDLLAQQRISDLQREMGDMLRQRATVRRLFEEMRILPDEQILGRWREGVEAMQVILWRDYQAEHPELHEALDFFLGIDQSALVEADKMTPWVRIAYQAAELAKQAAGPKALVEVLSQIGDMRGGVQKNWASKEQLQQIKAYLGSLRDLAKGLVGRGFLDDVGEVDQQALSRLRLWLQLWDEIEGTYQRLKREQGMLDFDDLEIETERLLARAPRPSRLKMFLSQIRHLMVDEFQDTNQSQQRIVYALAQAASVDASEETEGLGEAMPSAALLATPSSSQATQTSLLTPQSPLFVVGDAKQSIYRFRQAQVSVFQRTASDIAALTGDAALPLSQSFRTHRRLVDALNTMFSKILSPTGEDYEDFEARPGPLQAARELPMEHPASKAPLEICIVPEKLEDRRLSSEEVRIWEGRWLARRIQGLLDEGFQIWDKEQRQLRPVRLGDIAILFRATTHIPLYEEELKRAGLSYLTVSGRGYYQRPEVQDVIALLACLDHPGDDLGLAIVLRSPLFNLSDETLYRLRLHRPDHLAAQKGKRRSLFEALFDPPKTDQEEEVALAAQTFQALLDRLGKSEVWEILREALDRTGYEATLALRDRRMGVNGRQFGNLQKLMRMAREQAGADLGAFLRRLRDLQEMEAREGEAVGDAAQLDAVQLMSIHAAKGLEFPVVILADTGRRLSIGDAGSQILHDPAFGLVCKLRDAQQEWIRPSSYLWGEWFSRRMEEAENKRLFYVACTRAADLLIFSGKVGDRNSWMRQVLELWDIPPEVAPPEQDGPTQTTNPSADFAAFVDAAKQEVAAQSEAAKQDVAANTAELADANTTPNETGGQHDEVVGVTEAPRTIILPEDEEAFPANPFGPTADMPALTERLLAYAKTADLPATMFQHLSSALQKASQSQMSEKDHPKEMLGDIEVLSRGDLALRVFRLNKPLEAPALREVDEGLGTQVTAWPTLSLPLPKVEPLQTLLSPKLLDTMRSLAGSLDDRLLRERVLAEVPYLEGEGLYCEELPMLFLTEFASEIGGVQETWAAVWRARLLREALSMSDVLERSAGDRRDRWMGILHQEDLLFHVDRDVLCDEAEVCWTQQWKPFLQEHLSEATEIWWLEPFHALVHEEEFAVGQLDLLWKDAQGTWSIWSWCMHDTLGALESSYHRALALQVEAMSAALGESPKGAFVCMSSQGLSLQEVSSEKLSAAWSSWKENKEIVD